MTIVRKKGIARGRVQGVGFRVFVKNYAEQLDLTGWVKNMPDGTVHMELQGAPEKISELAEHIEVGNFIIKVESLDLEAMPVVEGEEAFIIR